MKEVEEFRATLAKYNQEHLIQFWSELTSDEQRRSLLNDLEHIDFAELHEYYKRVEGSLTSSSSSSQLFEDSSMQPVPNDLKGSYENASPDELKMYEKIGLEAIARNEVCALLLAGGQGTRLGVAHPKGMYSVGLRSGKTLYQLQAERLSRLRHLAMPDESRETSKQNSIPWYIMTSEHTKDLTEQFFAANDYFNLNKDNIKLFEQYMLPCLTRDGRVILDEKWRVSKAPDGNGGLYKALDKRGVLADMRARGIKYIHVYGVDNILVRVADPVFVGFCIHKQANCAAKVVKKTEPDEKVGVICQVNGRFQVVEYSEVSERIRNMRCHDNGDLVYNAGNICNHYFNLDFLTMVSEKHENELQHHIAEKKIAYVNEKGERVIPSHTNGIKLEKFVFDVFPFSTNFAIWEVVREEEFSPLKNGLDAKKENALTCKQDLYDLHYKWLQQAGARFEHKSDQEPIEYEISPLVSYNGEALSDQLSGKVLKPGLLIELDQATNQIKLINK